MSTDPDALFERVAAAPDDPVGWAVLADWLLTTRDVRGPLVQAALEGHSSVRALEAALEREDPALWPPELLSWTYTSRPSWRTGLWRGLELNLDWLEDEEVCDIEQILAHPMARLLERLRLSFESQMDWEDHLYALDGLSALTTPLALDLSSAHFEGFGPLEQVPDLRELTLSYVRQRAVPEVGGLEALEVQGCEVQHLPWIGRRTTLQRLSLKLDLDTPTIPLELLAPLVGLEALSLEHTGGGGGTELAPLAALPRLRRLRIVRGTATLGALGELPGLRELGLLGLSMDRVPARVCQQLIALEIKDWPSRVVSLPQLEALHLHWDWPTHRQLLALAGLRRLRLSYVRKPPGVRRLPVEELWLHSSPLTADLARALLQAGTLQQLVLDGYVRIDKLGPLGKLAGLPDLRVLDLSGCTSLPARHRWRFEGREVPWAFQRLAEDRLGT